MMLTCFRHAARDPHTTSVQLLYLTHSPRPCRTHPLSLNLIHRLRTEAGLFLYRCFLHLRKPRAKPVGLPKLII